MNADRNQPGNQKPPSARGFDNAPTTAPTGSASSTPVASHDLLFGRLALINGCIDQESLDNAFNQKETDPPKLLAEILLENGSISEKERRAIELLCETHSAKHGDDAQRSLASLTMGGTVSFRQPPGAATVTYSQQSADGKQPQGTFGDYELLEEIARGGMGRVLAAHDRTLDREVALKILLPGANADRFVRESKITARLPHPGIPPVYALGTLDNGSPFLAMKLIAGQTLAEELKTADRPRLFQVFTQVCQAVGFAHSRRVIHRDLKPANIMVGAFGEVQVMDWGLAKDLACREVPAEARSSATPPVPIVGADPNRTTDHRAVGESTDDRTQAGTIMGTPAYMAPEQARGEATDARADVFALGGILCAILTGQPPFTGRSTLEVIQRAATADLTEALARLDGCGAEAELVSLCRRCLSPRPIDRPTDGQAVADGITAYLNGVQERLHQTELAEAEAKTKATEQRKRRRVVAALSAVVVIILVVGSLVAKERQNAVRAAELVDSLVNADIAQVPAIVERLRGYEQQANPLLKDKLAEAKEGSTQQLHLALALAESGEGQIEALRDRLLTISSSQFPVVRDALAPYYAAIVQRLWEIATDTQQEARRRFQAACALATYSPNDERWSQINAFVAGRLVTLEASELVDWRKALRPAKKQMIEPLAAIYRNAEDRLQRTYATETLADYAAEQPEVLVDLLAVADQFQFPVIFARLTAYREQAVPLAEAELAKAIDEAASEEQKERLAKRRANAAVTLFRWEACDTVWPLLSFSPDPRARSYFIHWVSPLGGDPGPIVLRILMDEEPDVTIRRALIQSLGEFDDAQLPAKERQPLIEKLFKVYEYEPDAGLHGAVEWLLRKWDQSAILQQLVDRLKSNETQLSSRQANDKRRWYVNTQGQTMVVLDADEFVSGSPESEPDRVGDERQHRIQIGRQIAISGTEVTNAQYRAFQQVVQDFGLADYPTLASVVRTDDSPQTAVTWYEAARYCNWLSEQEGLSTNQWCYDTNADGKYDEGMKSKENYLELVGYRLPTEVEWEFACRGGTKTSRYYGLTETLLPQYAWYRANGKNQVWPVYSLKPNDVGLFNMLGNAEEWCDTPQVKDIGQDIVDDSPSGTVLSDKQLRAVRGGHFNMDASGLRSACCDRMYPSYPTKNTGFRVVRTFP